MITFYYLKDAKKIYALNENKFYFIYKKPSYLKKFILSLGLFFYSIGMNISYFGGYTHWIYNYNMIDDKIKFYLRIAKTIPHLF